jgi:lysophospholipase L1-like esterase
MKKKEPIRTLQSVTSMHRPPDSQSRQSIDGYFLLSEEGKHCRSAHPQSLSKKEMRTFLKAHVCFLVVGIILKLSVPAHGESVGEPVSKLRIYIAGDSTAAIGNGADRFGWGEPFGDLFNPALVEIRNMALPARSSRTYITQGHWERLLSDLRAGDWVMIQFGHNDMGAINEEPPGSEFPLRARGTIKGLGDESEWIDNVLTGQRELVHTYGFYMRKMVLEARAKGANPILLSLTARNIWKDGALERGAGAYGEWSRQIAQELKVPFLPLTETVVGLLEPRGPHFMSRFYPHDHTHTNFAGAEIHARVVLQRLVELTSDPVKDWLSPRGWAALSGDPLIPSDENGDAQSRETSRLTRDKAVRFVFSDTPPEDSQAIHVKRSDTYTPAKGYGYDMGTRYNEQGDPFYFSVSADEGNYRVQIDFGHDKKGSETTVKSETRRLMLEKVKTMPGETVSRSILVNIRNDRLKAPPEYAPGGKKVILNVRETGKLVWDDKLTLEFNGEHPGIRSLRFEPVEVPTVYLAGDSTVSDQRYQKAKRVSPRH